MILVIGTIKFIIGYIHGFHIRIDIAHSVEFGFLLTHLTHEFDMKVRRPPEIRVSFLVNFYYFNYLPLAKRADRFFIGLKVITFDIVFFYYLAAHTIKGTIDHPAIFLKDETLAYSDVKGLRVRQIIYLPTGRKSRD